MTSQVAVMKARYGAELLSLGRNEKTELVSGTWSRVIPVGVGALRPRDFAIHDRSLSMDQAETLSASR